MDFSHVLKLDKNEDNSEFTELLKKAKNGDSEAFGKLYDLYFNKIYRFIYYRVSHKETAEDLAEEVFIKVHNKIKNLEAEGAFQAWLYQIARNLVIDHYRRQKSTVALEEVENIIEYESNIIDVLNLEAEQKSLLKILKQLSPEEQILLKMKFFEELDNTTIAALLNKSEGAIRIMQFRTLAKLKKLFGPTNS